MSTAGKVLIVITALVTLGWIYLFSMVSQLNRNWGKAIANQIQQAEAATTKLAETQLGFVETRAVFERSRAETTDQIRLLRQEIESLAVQVAEADETLDRVKLELENEKQTIVTAQAAADRRAQELAQTTAALEKARADLNALAQENDKRLAELSQLQERFVALTNENREILQRAAETPPASPPVGASASNRGVVPVR
jgi:chromosome segregation ATPase